MNGSEPSKPTEEAAASPARAPEGGSKPFVVLTTSQAQDFHKVIPHPVQYYPFNDKSGGTPNDSDILDKPVTGTHIHRARMV